MSQGDVGPLKPGAEDTRELRRLWVWVLVLGVVLVILGMVAIGHAAAATVLSVLIYGWLLLIGGAVQIVYAVWARRWSGFFLLLLDGVLCLLVGAMMVRHPVQAEVILTFLLAIFFLVGGIMRMIASLVWGFPNRLWQFLSGLITAVLGVLIWSQWPVSGLWVIGLFVGIDLLFNGWSLVMLALIGRRALSPTA